MTKYRNLIAGIVSRQFSTVPGIIADFEDLLQIGYEGLLDAQRAWIPEKGSFTSYARRRIRGRILDYLKSNWKHTIPERRRTDIASNHTPECNLERKEIADIVHREIRKLNKYQRRVIRDVFLKGITQVEIARTLNCTGGNIAIHKSKAMYNLEQQLRRRGITTWPVTVKEVILEKEEEDG